MPDREVYRTEYGSVRLFPNEKIVTQFARAHRHTATGCVGVIATARGESQGFNGWITPRSLWKPTTWFRHSPEVAIREAIDWLNQKGEALARADAWAETTREWADTRDSIEVALEEVNEMLRSA